MSYGNELHGQAAQHKHIAQHEESNSMVKSQQDIAVKQHAAMGRLRRIGLIASERNKHKQAHQPQAIFKAAPRYPKPLTYWSRTWPRLKRC